MRRFAAALVALSLTGCVSPSSAPGSQTCARVETLASYPHGAFLENLLVERSGRVIFTNYTGGELNAYSAGAGVVRFAALPAHPVSILPLGEGYLVAAHGAPFTSGPAFLQTNQFLVLDRRGAVTRTIAAPEARFLNGMLLLRDGVVLVADSVLGRVWRLDVASGALTPWLDAPELRPDPSGRDQRPGANGLKREGSQLYISNSFTGRIYAVGIDAAGRAEGALREAAAPGRVDDFVIDPAGGFIAATHGDTVVWTRAGEADRVVLPEGGDGSTAVAYASPSRAALYVLTTGRFVEGGDRPARLLRVALPGGARLCS